MHPRADSLTFLFTTQSGYEEVGDRGDGAMGEGKEEARKKSKRKMKRIAVFPSIILLYPAHIVVVLCKMPLSRLVGCAPDNWPDRVAAIVVDVDNQRKKWEAKS